MKALWQRKHDLGGDALWDGKKSTCHLLGDGISNNRKNRKYNKLIHTILKYCGIIQYINRKNR